MGIFAKGSIVLVDYPFSDLTRSKLRPAVVLAEVSDGDFILCQITTKPYRSRVVIPIEPTVDSKSGLRQLSYARTEKLFTAHESVIREQIGFVSKGTLDAIVNSIISILR
jgi:mRNA interferase MazF